MKPLEFEKVSVADARAALEGPSKAEPATEVRRRSDTTAVLLDSTRAWMAELPYAVRPGELAQRYPRIANSIAELWPRPARCDEYLESLLVDLRGNRKGFPYAVAQELAALRAHYAELHPTKQSTWDRVERSK